MIAELHTAKDLMENEQYEAAINVLSYLNGLPLKYENFRLLLLSNCFYKTEEYDWAIETASQLLQNDHTNEYASRIKYLAYYELEDYDSALNEIISFLSDNKADLYKSILEEFLIDVRIENIADTDIVYKMKELALKNNIYL
ncbi:hypothetical protein [Chryseobacterium arthrosphaerae]|uniref:hypothetical protein n=1 Tax=Chryseobacterium arthrosphaerae TaxID=651561 RepID=UPI0031E246DA